MNTEKKNKRVVFTMGGKGGVGKTGLMVSLAEWFETNEIPFTLLDLDTENKARGSLKHFFNGSVAKVNIHTPAGLDAFIDHLESGAAIILADMGAGSGQVATDWFDAMYEDVAATGARFTAVGVVTPDPASVESVLAWANRLQERAQYLIVQNATSPQADFSYWESAEQAIRFREALSPIVIRMDFRLAELENPARQHGIRLGLVATRQNAINELKRASIVMRAESYRRRLFSEVRPGKGDVPPMSADQELLNLAGAESENPTLFDELAGLVPAERQAEYYRVIAHTRTLSPNDEMLRVLEAMGILALLTRETPAAIAVERKSFQKILENALSKADEVEKRLAAYTSRLESRITQLPKELEIGLDPPRIARLLGESLRQRFQQSGLPDTARALDQSCSEMNSVQKQLVNVMREVAHPDIGVIARVRSANDSLLRSMTTRAQQMDDFVVRLEKQVWAIWLPVVASAALALGFALGTWFANVRQGTPEASGAAQPQQMPMP
jgi:MinD-like ATPase involved in chromosome partitioning or flagellar assembly